MKRIKQLSKHLINQIAAGEVIERPVSVVKELVENSIDAGATKVSIDITNECRNIRVADNGSGIHPDDIMLAFSKHATSKIYESDDLYDINTLGFRGEALSSIISISKLSCTTRTKDFETGVKVHCENSEVKQCETGCAVGTIMDIRDLFYNIPARLKFLKSSSTEFSYIQEFVQHIAIINPNCSIELKNNGKTVLKTSGQGNLLQAIREVYSPDVAKHLKEVGKTDKLSGLKISGYVSTPDYTRSGKKGYHMYINSRSVKCPVFQKAIDTAYKNLTANGKYPFVVLNFPSGFRGTLYFDELKIYRNGMPSTLKLTAPALRIFRSDDGKFEVSAAPAKAADPLLLAVLHRDKKILRSVIVRPDLDNVYRGDFGKGLETGDAALRLIFADAAAEVKLGVLEIDCCIESLPASQQAAEQDK